MTFKGPIKHVEVVAALREFADDLDSRKPMDRIEEYGIGGSCEQLFLDCRLRIRVEVIVGFVDGVAQVAEKK